MTTSALSSYLVMVALGATALSSSCAASLDSNLPKELLEGGYEKQVIATKDGKRLQLTRRFDVSYPRMVISDKHHAALKVEGWKRCVGPNEQWDSVFETEQKRFVNQVTHYWTRDHRLLAVNMRYVTPAGEKPPASPPASSVQLVTVLVDEYGGSLEDVVAKLQLKCSG